MQSTGQKICKAIGIFVSLLVTCLVFIVCLLGMMNSKKSSVDDSDLIFARPQIPVESNAFWTLLKATNELYWPRNLDRKLDDLSDDTNWDDSLAADTLAKNQTCLSSFDEAMKQPFLLVLERKSFDEDESYLSGWKQLSFLKSIQFNSLHRAKNDEAALGDAFEILDFGQRIENSGGPIIYYLVGEGIKNIGLTRIRQMAADTTLSETNLIQVVHELDAFGPDWDGLTNALKVEYTIQCRYLDDFAKANIPDTTNSDSERAAMSIGMKPFFNPKKTKMELAQADHFILDNLSKPYAEIDQSEIPQVNTNASFFRQLISGNLVGDVLFEMLGPELDVIPRAKSRENVALTATQLILALKVYDMQHSRLPDSLSELVPEFFPQVPLDDFDGKPFRYLPDKRIIYSVGPCLKDLGGEERKNFSPDYNLPFQIGF